MNLSIKNISLQEEVRKTHIPESEKSSLNISSGGHLGGARGADTPPIIFKKSETMSLHFRTFVHTA